ncbi:MAG TPA: ectoine utilization protein EutC [Devosia sp.]|jgi:ornithine cyclodeaminase|nr:ectoine utilization protein EutC [Devosia sp.]
MPEITILTEAELRQLVPLDADAIACVEEAFRALATRQVVMPPILRLDIAESNGEVDVKTAYVPGLPSFAIKISPGFFDNPRLGLPSVNGLMVVLSATTGLLEAALFDNGYLTDVRTAAAGAVAAKHLARADAESAAVLGAGVQALLQLKALALVRPIRRARLWARDTDRATAAARALSDELGIPVVPAMSALEAVKGADIVVTTTPSRTPILLEGWLEPGQHVTAMGSDAGHKNEIDPAVFRHLDAYVPDRLSQTRLLGELHHALAAGLVAPDAEFAELGAVLAGTASGRRAAEDITLCDLTGTGVQDTAIANLALIRARHAGAGQRFAS